MNMAKSMAELGKHSTPKDRYIWKFDVLLVASISLLLILGLIMVGSASVVVSQNHYHWPFHFLLKQIIYTALGLIALLTMLSIDLQWLQKMAPYLLVLIYFLLLLVLVPGIGREVNGSTRWIGFGPIGFQVSELAKLFSMIYLADYLTRHNREVQTQFSGFIKPMVLLGVLSILLLKEPDFGAVAVIMATALGMMFLAGARFWQFLLLFAAVCTALALLAIASPYRLERLTSFVNPWSHAYASGYQLTQSLIAFGRGGWFGVGLGDSVQKLFYLPEAHTDFLFAIYAEEFGLVGVLVLISLFIVLVARALRIAWWANYQGNQFGAFLGYGLGLWLAMQTMINIGVNAGVLPTKGLTLPLMSYGGSSMIVMLTALGILLRIDYETKIWGRR